MASQLFVLALAGSMAIAHSAEPMPPGHEMGPIVGDSNSMMTAADHAAADMALMVTTTAEPTTADLSFMATTALPTAIMPSDVTDVSGTPTTLVVDTQTPPPPSSSLSWALTTSHDMSHMSHANVSGNAMPTGGASSSGAAGSANASVDNINSATRNVYSKISIGVMALCIFASVALQM